MPLVVEVLATASSGPARFAPPEARASLGGGDNLLVGLVDARVGGVLELDESSSIRFHSLSPAFYGHAKELKMLALRPPLSVEVHALLVLSLVAACGSTATQPAYSLPTASARDDSGSPATTLRDLPDHIQARQALSSVQPAVSACGRGEHGLAMTNVWVSGATGRVTRAAVVAGDYVGTPIGECIERAASQAQFPRFRNPEFRVQFPYRP